MQTDLKQSKLPPNDIELEKVVLGSLLLEPDSYYTVSNILSDECFYTPSNRYIFKSIRLLIESGTAVDLLTVTDSLRKEKQLQLIGGPMYINKLTDKVISSVNIEQHCYLLREKAIKRHQIDIGTAMAQKGFDESVDALEANDWATEEVFKMATLSTLSNEQSNEEVANEIMDDIYLAAMSDGITGLKTGYKEQDEILGGYQGSNVIVWAARPGMGKTAKMLCEAYYIAVVLDEPVLIFSLEMSRKEMFKRLAVIHAKIGSWIYRQKEINDAHTEKFKKTLFDLATKNIIIDDTPAISPQQVRNRAKKEMVKNNIKIIFIDYLQLMTGQGKDTVTEISFCSRKNKALAKELDLPVVVLAQINRNTTTRGGDKEPMLSDLKGSGSIEEDADIVGFIHRPPYYDEHAEDKKEAYFLIAKNRHGSLARIESRYLHDRTQFVDPGEDVYRFDDNDNSDALKSTKGPFF